MWELEKIFRGCDGLASIVKQTDSTITREMCLQRRIGDDLYYIEQEEDPCSVGRL